MATVAIVAIVATVATVLDSQSEKVDSNAACAPKQGTLSHMLYLWTEM